MTNVECLLTNGGIAPLSRFKTDRSTKDSRLAEYIIRCSTLIRPLAGFSDNMLYVTEGVRCQCSSFRT